MNYIITRAIAVKLIGSTELIKLRHSAQINGKDTYLLPTGAKLVAEKHFDGTRYSVYGYLTGDRDIPEIVQRFNAMWKAKRAAIDARAGNRYNNRSSVGTERDTENFFIAGNE